MNNRQAIEVFIENLQNKKNDMMTRQIPFMGGIVHICYIGQLVDRRALSELVIKPMVNFCAGGQNAVNATFAAANLLYADQIEMDGDLDHVEAHMLDGNTVVLFSNDRQYIVINLRKVEKRDVSTPELMYSLRGPRDAFVENLDTNLSLIRYRLKDKNLCIEKKVVGERTKSAVAVIYIRDIANSKMVDDVNKRIDAIHTGGIYETGELQNFMKNDRFNLFPRMGIIERSDMAVEKLLEGKVIVLVDGSNTALQAPIVFAEFLYACDDRYENKFFGMFMRILRYAAVFLSISLTSYYVALAEFHTDVMPASYIVTFAQMRARAPFSPLLAVLSIEFIIELMREALLRVPVKIGSAIAIVGGIIIGQAASSSGIFSPLLLILTSIAFLSSFAIPDISLANPFRILKFLVILMTGFLGFYGFSLAITLILCLVVSIDSFGVPYLAPWAPFNFYDFLRTFMFSKQSSPKRQQYMRNKDDTRAPGSGENKQS